MEAVVKKEVAKLFPSPLNPRETFDDGPMAELTASVKARGVIVPLLVRSAKGGRYEVIAGARRLRAAKAAKLVMVPVIVEDMTDEFALETMVIENSQREDMLPLEEAAGYVKLVGYGRAPEDIAAKVGRPLRFVLQRLSLDRLIDPAKAALRQEKILLGHALLIARLPDGEQKSALELASPREAYVRRPTVDDLRSQLDDRLRNISSAAFKASDGELVKKAGACTDCLKRSGANQELFPDVKSPNLCLDPVCFEEKLAAHVNTIIAAYEEKDKDKELVLLLGPHEWKDRGGALGTQNFKIVEKKKDRCEHTKVGLYVGAGATRGRQIQVCPTRVCTKHWQPHERKPTGSSAASIEARRKTLQQSKRIAAVAVRLRSVATRKAARTITARTPHVLTFLAHSAERRGGADAARVYVKVAGLVRPGEKLGKIDYRARIKEHIETLAKGPEASKLLVQFLVAYAIAEDENRAKWWGDGLDSFRRAAIELDIDLKPLVKEADKQLRLDTAAKGRRGPKAKAKSAPKAKAAKKKARRKQGGIGASAGPRRKAKK